MTMVCPHARIIRLEPNDQISGWWRCHNVTKQWKLGQGGFGAVPGAGTASYDLETVTVEVHWVLDVVVVFDNNLNNFAALDYIGIYAGTVDDGVERVLACCEGCVEGRNLRRNVDITPENNTMRC